MRTVLTDKQLITWGWRLPFLSGILISFVAMYLRDHGKEHNPNAGEYADEDDSQCNNNSSKESPLSEVFKRENLPALLSSFLTPMMWGGGYYTTFVWMAIFMEVLVDPPIEHGFWVNACSLLFGIIIPLPLAGMLSDRLGRDKTMSIGVIGLAILGPFMVNIISSGQAVEAFFAQWIIGLCLSLFGGPMNAWLVERFPPHIRLTSAALGYDLSHCTASAFSPLIATLLVQNHGVKAPGLLYPLFAILTGSGMLISTKIYRYGGVTDNDQNEVQMATSSKPKLNPVC